MHLKQGSCNILKEIPPAPCFDTLQEGLDALHVLAEAAIRLHHLKLQGKQVHD